MMKNREMQVKPLVLKASATTFLDDSFPLF